MSRSAITIRPTPRVVTIQVIPGHYRRACAGPVCVRWECVPASTGFPGCPTPEESAGMLTGLGVASPTLFAWLVTIAELVGGALLVVGLLTRLVTLPLIATLVGAVILVKADAGMPEAGIDIALLSGLAALLLIGPGRLSLDRLAGIEPHPIESTSTGDRHGTLDPHRVPRFQR
ncbi:MAG: DoxX family protein [Pedococcus sp.]